MRLYRKNGKRLAHVQRRITELRHQAHHYTYCFGAKMQPDHYRAGRRVCAGEYAVMRGWTTFQELSDKGLWVR